MGLQDVIAARSIGFDRPRPLTAAGAGLLCALAATLLRAGLQPVLGEGYPFLTYYLAVVVAAAAGGLVGGGVAFFASMLLAWYFFVPEVRSFELLNERETVGLVTFAVSAGLTGAVALGLRSALQALSRAEARQKLLIDELNHRVKNTLATVQSLAFQTARTTPSNEDFQARFSARLGALASAHDLLNRHSWEGAELGALLDQVLKPFESERGRIRVDGPDVSLSPNAAVTMTLALHELATNAMKHGALARDEGRLDVQWAVKDAELAFEWRESGVRDMPADRGKGFGTRLLAAAARELEARAETEFTPDGVAHRWRAPLGGKVRAA